MTHYSLLTTLHRRLIVSCQAEPPSPFNTPAGVAAFAQCAVMGGAAAIRSCGIDKTHAILSAVSVPVIGLTKAKFEDGTVCITGNMHDVDELVDIGAHIIAIDGTFRLREGMTGPEFIHAARLRHPRQLLMADIATIEEAVACRQAGADCVSTTLAGYTPQTLHQASQGPSLRLLEQCVSQLADFPVFAEGRYNTPKEAAEAIRHGAYAVVVGSAITRPHLITQWFVESVANCFSSGESVNCVEIRQLTDV